MRIDRHIFGSIRGYQTLARTDGITDADVRVLEGLSVGAPASSSVLAALAACPAYVVLPLGGRRAVTRISEGNPDDQGRPTIQQVTLVVSKAHWDTVLKGDVLSLIRREDLWRWDGQPSIQVMDLPSRGSAGSVASPESADKILAMLSLLERGVTGGKPVLVREQDFTLEEFGLLERLLPPAARAGQTLIYRAFGVSARASLVCIAREAALAPADGMYRPGQPVDPSPYALAVAQAGFKLGHIPDGFVQSYRGFAMAGVSRPSLSTAAKQNLPAQVIVERTPRRLIAGLMITSLLLAAVVVFLTWRLYSRTAQLIGREDTHRTELAALQAKLDDAYKARAITEQANSAALSALQSKIQSLEASAAELSALQSKIQLLEASAAEKSKRIGDLQGVMGELIQNIALPVLDNMARGKALELCRQAAGLMSEDADASKAANERIAFLDQQRQAMTAAEGIAANRTGQPSVVGRLSMATTRPANDPELQTYYKRVCEAVQCIAAPVDKAVSAAVPMLPTSGHSDGGTNGGRLQNASEESRQRNSTDSGRLRFAESLQAPGDFSRVLAVLENMSTKLNSMRTQISDIRARVDSVKQKIQAISSETNQGKKIDAMEAATKLLSEVANVIDSWRNSQTIWIQKDLDELRAAMQSDAKLDSQGAQ
jgi:predicted  nucleic acid-binding Zn-ribbon protein